MIILKFNRLWRAISPKDAPRMEVGEKKTFTSWGGLAEFGRTHTLNEADFDVRPLGNGWVLERLK